MMDTFLQHLHLPVTCLNRADVLLTKLEGVSDPEKKRKLIGADFVEAFTEEAHRLEATLGSKPGFLVQVSLCLGVWRTRAGSGLPQLVVPVAKWGCSLELKTRYD